MYLFGTSNTVTDSDLYLTIGNASGNIVTPSDNTTGSTPESPKSSPDYSTYVIIGIVIAGGAAVYLFMRKR